MGLRLYPPQAEKTDNSFADQTVLFALYCFQKIRKLVLL